MKKIIQKRKETREQNRKENPNYDKEIQEKTKATNIERRGVPYPLMSKEVQEKVKQTNLDKRGVEFASQSEEVKDKMKVTNLERRGVEYAGQSKEVHKKSEETNLKKYGHKNPFQVDEFKEKSKQTNLEKRGVKYAAQSKEVKEKTKQTNVERRGVDNPMKSEEVREKGKRTNLERRGVENVMQDKSVFDKANNSFEKKEYIFPSGKKVNFQGFEYMALNLLIEEGYDEEDILINNNTIPVIEYFMDEKPHKFYPDIYIKSEDRIIEVKSTFTYKQYEEKNLAKLKYSSHLNVEFWIFSKNGDLEILYSSDYSDEK